MFRKSSFRMGRPAFAALAVMSLSACAQAPVAEIEAADAAIQAAYSAGVDEYAPATMGQARDLRAQVDVELALQTDKFALTRSYDHALELANQAKAAADAAGTEAAATKEAVRQETTVLLETVKVALQEVQVMLANAPRGKGSAADLAALQADLDATSVALTEGETALGEGRYLEAKTKVTAVQSGVETVRSAITAAQAARRGPGS